MPRTKGSHNRNAKLIAAVIAAAASFPKKVSAPKIIDRLNEPEFLKIYNLQKDQIPKRRTVEDIVKDNLKKIEKMRFSPEDEPWHISTLPDFPIPSDTLLKVLDILFEKLRQKPPVHISIRQAKWIARLASIIKDDKDNSILWHYASYYSLAEKNKKLLNYDLADVNIDADLYKDIDGKWALAGDFTHYIYHQERWAEQKRLGFEPDTSLGPEAKLPKAISKKRKEGKQ